MKFNGVFVAAMVITSANAGRPDKPEGGDKNTHTTGSSATSSSSVSNSMFYTALKQMRDYSIIQSMFTKNEKKNDLLIKIFEIKEEIFDLVARIEDEYSKYRTTMKLVSPFVPAGLIETISSGGPSYFNVQKILGEIDRYLNRLYTLDYKYIEKYGEIAGPPHLGFWQFKTFCQDSQK
ncbi:hypothetical protein BASA60_007445 [Batrachochytrium salamandrivorans]|nr:hypothetical protein BASA60_007445 [Batrachochytrium salamandrivorans]